MFNYWSFKGINGFGKIWVNGFSLVPFPPAMMTVLTFLKKDIFFLSPNIFLGVRKSITYLLLSIMGMRLKSGILLKIFFTSFDLNFPLIKKNGFFLYKDLIDELIFLPFNIPLLKSPSVKVPNNLFFSSTTIKHFFSFALFKFSWHSKYQYLSKQTNF